MGDTMSSAEGVEGLAIRESERERIALWLEDQYNCYEIRTMDDPPKITVGGFLARRIRLELGEE